MKEDFISELVGIYPLEECLEKEKELSKTSLYPKGLNGNSGTHVVMTEEVREKISESAKKNNRKQVENGTHPFIGRNNPSHKRIENGTHNFLDSDTARKNNLKRVENGTHHFLGPETNRKRVENGTHNLQSKNRVTALNIETGEVHNISSELYYSRRDIYFTTQSNVFKQWKTRKYYV